jgi:hypothetical protein
MSEHDLIAKVNEIRAKNKKNQAYVQLGIGVVSTISSIAITCASVGSLG